METSPRAILRRRANVKLIIVRLVVIAKNSVIYQNIKKFKKYYHVYLCQILRVLDYFHFPRKVTSREIAEQKDG